MKLLIQRVTRADVTVDGNVVGEIGKGLLVFVGFSTGDTEEMMRKMADKMMRLRIFSDENDKINLSLQEVRGEILLVSQFTLYADCRRGNRPSFTQALEPEEARVLYEKCAAYCQEAGMEVETGIFGADMKVSLENDGPFTVLLDANDICR